MSEEAYLTEIFSSIQGEGGSIKGSCFGKRQIFIRFAGCNLAKGDFGTNGCYWCDSKYSQIFNPNYVKIEKSPGSQQFSQLKNPITFDQLLDIIKSLITPDLHSISLTGGEPLCQLDFIFNFADLLLENNLNLPLYLETNGSVKIEGDKLNKIGIFKYCCCDLKDKHSNAADNENWEKLIQSELNFIKNIINKDVITFAKIVVSSNTLIEDIEYICEKLSKIRYKDGSNVGLAIQPVILESQDKEQKFRMDINFNELNQIFYKVAEYLNSDCITLSIQAHKFLNLL
ncbi:MAG: hypothetical protein ACTSQS_02005 [Promethearchaeota archaeon]